MAPYHDPHKDICVYNIYVLISQFDPRKIPKVFLGMTTRHDLKGVLRTQRSKGRRKKGIVASLFRFNSQVSIHLLEQVEATGSDAHRHLLAWTRYFMDSGYHVVTGSKIYEQANSMHATTEEIYQVISQRPISEILTLHLVPEKESRAEPSTNSTPDPKPQTENPSPIPLSSRVSIRVTGQELQSFRALCSRRGMTQREMFLTLMENAGEENCAQELISRLTEQNEALKNRIRKLEEQAKNPRAELVNREYRRCIQVQHKALARYFAVLSQDWPKPDPNLCTLNPFRALPFTSLWSYYKYPTENRLFRFRLERMYSGKGKYGALFLFGQDLNRNEPVKLRFYPRSSFWGVSPLYGSFYDEGSCLLVGCRMRGEVAELHIAFPLLPQEWISPEAKSRLNTRSPINDSFDFELSEKLWSNLTEKDIRHPDFETPFIEIPDFTDSIVETESPVFPPGAEYEGEAKYEGKDKDKYKDEENESPQGVVQDILDDAISRSG